MQELLGAMHAVIDVHEAARLLAVAPNLNVVLARDHCHGDFARNSGWRLLAPAIPRAERAIYVMIARNARFDPEILAKMPAQALREQLFPTIPILTVGGISVGFLKRTHVS